MPQIAAYNPLDRNVGTAILGMRLSYLWTAVPQHKSLYKMIREIREIRVKKKRINLCFVGLRDGERSQVIYTIPSHTPLRGCIIRDPTYKIQRSVCKFLFFHHYF